MMTRRQAIKSMALSAAALSTLSSVGMAQSTPATGAPAAKPADAPTGPFHLPGLDYPFDALEPYIDAQTMQIHHDKHHAAYVANLNKAVAAHPELGQKSVEELVKSWASAPEDARAAIRNQGGGHANHSLFWTLLRKGGPDKPGGDLAKALDTAFGSFAGFQEKFTQSAMGVFGSGWAWLSLTGDRKLVIESTPNQDSPISAGHVPLLGLDVWEHAYYLKYQNRRAEYVAAFPKVIHWDAVQERYANALKG
jgi:Fe-Mn family superoxide dismutase